MLAGLNNMKKPKTKKQIVSAVKKAVERGWLFDKNYSPADLITNPKAASALKGRLETLLGQKVNIIV
jgi:hypothetical protein